MNTQTHMLMGAALLGSQADPGVTVLAALGGLLPDLPMIGMVMWARWAQAKPFREIFGTLYFSPRWQAWLAPWHALPLWSALLAAGLLLGSPGLIALAASALLHVAIDFFLHVDDAHRHFWPLSDWRFKSPVSYWDRRHHGHVFQPFEVLLAIGCTLLLMRQFATPPVVIGLAAVLALNVLTLAVMLLAPRRP